MLALTTFAISQEQDSASAAPVLMYDLGISIDPGNEKIKNTGNEILDQYLQNFQKRLDSLTMILNTHNIQITELKKTNDSLGTQVQVLRNQVFLSPYASLSPRMEKYNREEGEHFFQKGNSAYSHEKYIVAIEYFTQAINSKISTAIIGDAYYWIANCYIQLSDDHLALEYLKKVIEYPLSSKTDDALFLAAITYRKLSNYKTAKIFFNRILSRYPNTKFSNLAKFELKKMEQ